MSKKIMVVDNHPLILQFLSNLLEKEGHHVLTAKDGLSALEAMKTFVPDVVFVDLIMPNISGKRLCRIMRKRPHLKDIYIVILSAVAAEEKVDFVEFGANACIAKGPFNKMAEHVLHVIAQVDKKETASGSSREILGVEHVTAREITKELLSVKHHFEVILKGMSEGILEISAESKIVYANPTSLALMGLPEESLLTSDFVELFNGTDRRRIEKVLDGLVDGPQEIPQDSPVSRNGKQFAIKVAPLAANERKAVVMLKDVSEHAKLQAKLQEAQKMEAIGTLAGGIAHDFNNLLMAIQGNVSLMLLETDATHPHQKRLQAVQEHIRSGSRLTNQLLGYARKGRYEVRPFNLNDFVSETLDAFERGNKMIAVTRGLAESLAFIEADQGQVEQILINLCANASDALPDGGEIEVTTANVTHVEMKGKEYNPRPGEYVLLTVRDNGIGMDQKTLARVFEPFFTTKEMGRGTGLGLASVYGIVKGHGGYIDVESGTGKGTTFRIFLPAIGSSVGDDPNTHARPIT
jgi:two-component system cell cycle sensor histidine kinase/response regulator CckA